MFCAWYWSVWEIAHGRGRASIPWRSSHLSSARTTPPSLPALRIIHQPVFFFFWGGGEATVRGPYPKKEADGLVVNYSVVSWPVVYQLAQWENVAGVHGPSSPLWSMTAQVPGVKSTLPLIHLPLVTPTGLMPIGKFVIPEQLLSKSELQPI